MVPLALRCPPSPDQLSGASSSWLAAQLSAVSRSSASALATAAAAAAVARSSGVLAASAAAALAATWADCQWLGPPAAAPLLTTPLGCAGAPLLTSPSSARQARWYAAWL